MDRMKVIAGMLIMIALAGLPAGVQAEGADDGLVAEWHFDEGSGSVLGNIVVSSGHYFTTPEGVVRGCLERQGEGLDRCRLPGSQTRPGCRLLWCLR